MTVWGQRIEVTPKLLWIKASDGLTDLARSQHFPVFPQVTDFYVLKRSREHRRAIFFACQIHAYHPRYCHEIHMITEANIRSAVRSVQENRIRWIEIKDVHLVAALLIADTELEQIERAFKRENDWRMARKVSDVRKTLTNSLATEQERLLAMVTEFQDEIFAAQPARR